MKEIIFYKKENGEIPVKKFLNNLKIKDPKLMANIVYKIKLLSLGQFGYNDVKFLKSKIYELRIKGIDNISRVFYFNYYGNSIVLLDAYIKKDNKIKISILDRVIKYKQDFIKKYGNI